MKIVSFALLLVLALTPMAFAGEIKPYSQAEFDRLVAEGKPVLLDIHADWCPTCKQQDPIVHHLMGEAAYKDVTTLTVDFDTEKALLKTYNVRTQSTLIVFRGSKEVGHSVGDTTKNGIEGLLKKVVN
jgi:Thiol:disulfide interchange protein